MSIAKWEFYLGETVYSKAVHDNAKPLKIVSMGVRNDGDSFEEPYYDVKTKDGNIYSLSESQLYRKTKEETMNPEKEAQECSEEKWKQEVREIVREEIGNIFKPKGAQSVEINKVPEPQPQLTQKENNILKGLHYLGWKWIARHRDGDLSVYDNKPFKSLEYNVWRVSEGDCHGISVHPLAQDLNVFLFIQWKDEEPKLIADLIDWSDED